MKNTPHVDPEVTLRGGIPSDAEACGRICYEAFLGITQKHNFPPDFPSPEVAVGFLTMLLGHPGFHSIIAERDGRIVGSNFIDERSTIAGIGPITVDPAIQNGGIGRRLMQAALDRTAERKFAGARLLQGAYHGRSLALYASLGFDAREEIACMQGDALRSAVDGCTVRPATTEDLDACNAVCRAVHGHDRAGEMTDAIAQGTARVVVRSGRITGCASILAFFGHPVGETNEDVMALIAAAVSFGGPGILVPVRNGPLFRWCLANKLKVVQVLTLMSVGLYNEPRGAYLPSILY
jgi:GNAT superfamily N-acetyltransferase